MVKNSVKIVFFGTSDFAVPALKSLINFGYQILAVITQPEKPTGRLKVLMPSPVKRVALESNINVLEPHNLKNDEDFFKIFHKLNPDIAIVVSYGKIIPEKYLSLPKYGFLNIHPSLLPKYRGPSPIQTTILNGDTLTGITIIMMDKDADHGPILAQKLEMNIKNKNYIELSEELAKSGAELLIETLPKYITEDILPKEQDHSQATFTNLISRIDGHINWNKTAREIFNQIQAFNPEPGTWTTWDNKILNIKTVELTTYECVNKPLGLIEKISLPAQIGDSIAVATKELYLKLGLIQIDGGKEMEAKNFINGHPDFLGSKLE